MAPTAPRKLWEPPSPERTQMWEFMQLVNRKHKLNLKRYDDFYQYSVDNRSQFYEELLEWAALIYEGTYARAIDEAAPIDALPRWFEGVSLNWAENMLWSRSGRGGGGGGDGPTWARGTAGKEDTKIAVTEVREGASEVRQVTWAMLRTLAGRYAAALHAAGVRRGDRIVAVAANSVETLVVFLATSWLGAVFSSSSTDMGVQGILQRSVQINPKYIFMDDAALYNGKRVDLREKMAGIVAGMGECDQFEGLVSMRRFREPLDVSGIPRAQTLEQLLSRRGYPPPPIERVAFHEPYLICYSSGTTGIPKAIVHSAGGALLSYVKEARLQEDCGPASVTLQYTTTGWIMYMSAVGGLACGARAILYDGSPMQPDLQTFIRLIGDQRVTKLGTSPRWLSEVAKAGLSPRDLTDLSSLRVVTSTGMVLSEQLFEWFYDKGFPAHTQLANISGGTDIAGCFGGGNPISPVYVGGTQGPVLGVPIALYDSQLAHGEKGSPVPDGEPGELVATASFPNVPVFLWGDVDEKSGSSGGAGGSGPIAKFAAAAPGPKFRSAYFTRYPGVWAHGDFCARDRRQADRAEGLPGAGRLTFLGRADGVLNPSGVRFGSAEVYAVLERGEFAARVQDALCVGQRRPGIDEDERVLLFLLMRPGAGPLDAGLVARVKDAIARDLSKRHVPAYVFETPDIPTTVNLKKVELPVKQIVSGQVIKPSGTLLNPQSLDFFYQFAKLEEVIKRPLEKL